MNSSHTNSLLSYQTYHGCCIFMIARAGCAPLAALKCSAGGGNMLFIMKNRLPSYSQRKSPPFHPVSFVLWRKQGRRRRVRVMHNPHTACCCCCWFCCGAALIMLHDMTFWAMFATSQQTVQTSFIHHQSWPRARIPPLMATRIQSRDFGWCWISGCRLIAAMKGHHLERALAVWRGPVESDLPAVVALTGWVTNSVSEGKHQVLAGHGKTTLVDIWKFYNLGTWKLSNFFIF